jgi:hypothetical protein
MKLRVSGGRKFLSLLSDVRILEIYLLFSQEFCGLCVIHHATLAKSWTLNMTSKACEENFVRKPVVNLRRECKDNIKKESNL